MNLKMIKIIAIKESLDLFRDKRTILSMIIIPVIAIPLLVSAIGWFSFSTIKKLQDKTSVIAIMGSELAVDQADLLGNTAGLEVIAPPENLSSAELIHQEHVKLVVSFNDGIETAFDNLAAVETGEQGDEVPFTELPGIDLIYDSTDDEAGIIRSKVENILLEYRDATVTKWLVGQDIKPQIVRPWPIKKVDVAPPAKKAAEFLSKFLPYMILLLCLQSAMYPAMDLTAGEKERSTIETLLVNPVSRVDIVLGKYIAVSLMAIGSAVFTLGSEYIYFKWFVGSFADGAFNLELEPTSILMALALLVPVAMLFSAMLLAISIYARSMKEAQSYIGPLMMLIIFPSMASMIPGVELGWGLTLIPVFNVTLVMKSALLQDYSEILKMITVFGVNGIYAIIGIFIAVKLFEREKVIFRS
jgi:sodium transport system permease protein